MFTIYAKEVEGAWGGPSQDSGLKRDVFMSSRLHRQQQLTLDPKEVLL